MRNFALAAVIGIELMDSPISSEVRAASTEPRSNMPVQAVTGIDNERSISAYRKTASPRRTPHWNRKSASSNCIWVMSRVWTRMRPPPE
jgi:hypothetical protein